MGISREQAPVLYVIVEWLAQKADIPMGCKSDMNPSYQ